LSKGPLVNTLVAAGVIPAFTTALGSPSVAMSATSLEWRCTLTDEVAFELLLAIKRIMKYGLRTENKAILRSIGSGCEEEGFMDILAAYMHHQESSFAELVDRFLSLRYENLVRRFGL
jgi:hypothetical protein